MNERLHHIDLQNIDLHGFNLPSLDLGEEPSSTRIVVAMSGGVDSSVTAALMVALGYEVIGLTMQLYDQGDSCSTTTKTCCAGADIQDARHVAEKLDIPHYVLNYEDRFKQSVIDPFIESYVQGETPVPCIRCNQTVKFEDMLTLAKDLEAEALITGHYIHDRMTGNRRALFRPVDETRDQSYFLFATTQDQLNFLRFPLGRMEKADVRKLAQTFGLDVADKPDSQDICFVPDGDYKQIIARHRPEALKAGEIRHVDGYVLGQHEGIIHFTIGQRRGLGIAIGEPLFVLKIEPEEALVIVGPEEGLARTRIYVDQINWLGDQPVGEAFEAERMVAVKIRSTTPPAPARLGQDNKGCFVDLLSAERGVSAGQACVIYESEDAGSRLLGGGWITGST